MVKISDTCFPTTHNTGHNEEAESNSYENEEIKNHTTTLEDSNLNPLT
jgi:hypothetical protein